MKLSRRYLELRAAFRTSKSGRGAAAVSLPVPSCGMAAGMCCHGKAARCINLGDIASLG
jgi:hypothetical protein